MDILSELKNLQGCGWVKIGEDNTCRFLLATAGCDISQPMIKFGDFLRYDTLALCIFDYQGMEVWNGILSRLRSLPLCIIYLLLH